MEIMLVIMMRMFEDDGDGDGGLEVIDGGDIGGGEDG